MLKLIRVIYGIADCLTCPKCKGSGQESWFLKEGEPRPDPSTGWRWVTDHGGPGYTRECACRPRLRRLIGDGA